jgi:hypothetical protein
MASWLSVAARPIPPGIEVESNRWRWLGYGLGLALGSVTSVFLFGIPVQLSDSFTEFLWAREHSVWSGVWSEFQEGPYLRPFRRGLIKVIYQLSAGHYFLAFRGFHALQLITLLLLVVRALRVRSLTDAAILPLGLACVVGMHTFTAVVRESYPVNHFLTILICCTAAVNLSQGRHRVLNDVGAAALLLFAMFTIESGLLVWVVVAAGYVVGYRGVSRRALLVLTAFAVGYFVFRFILTGGTMPGLTERSAGFGFKVYDPADLQRMFGASPWRFYLYNVASAISSVLFGEPRGGVWAFTRGLLESEVRLWQVVNIVTSVGTTALLGIYVVRRLADWRRLRFNDADRLVLLFIALLPANAVFAAAYHKDVILSPAGVFYGLAACVVFRQFVFERDWHLSPSLRGGVVYGAMAVMALGWSVRLVGIHYNLRHMAESVRNEWAYYDDWDKEQGSIPLDPADAQIRQALYDDAIWRAPQPPVLSFRWADELFDRSQ